MVAALPSCYEIINEGIDNQEKEYVITKILFMSNRDGNTEIYMMNPDGTEQQRLFYYPSSSEYCPSWSPDGRYVLFASNMGGFAEIYVAKADGTEVKALTKFNSSVLTWPTWSPDGSWIAFICDKDGSRDLYIMDIYGTNVRRLTNDGVDNYSMTWRSDSKSIVYDTNGLGLYSVNIDGTGLNSISGTNGHSGPTFSPDDRYLYTQNGGIWKMNYDGTNQTNLTASHGLSSYGHVVLSPDGSELFYMAITGGNYHIFKWLNLTASGKQQLTFLGTDNEYLAYKIR